MTLSQLFTTCLQIPYERVGVSANYALKRDKETLYIFFQGSDGATDWKNNLDFPAKPSERADKSVWFAHRGFLKVWEEIQPFLQKDIEDRHYKEIIISGYSHGGALAMLCHEYVYSHRPDLRDTLKSYGFGAPRVFWGIKTREIKRRFESYTVIRNINDVVTRLPPAFLGFRHVGELLKIGAKGNYTAVDAHRPQNILKELLKYENT